jgi:RHS repeat-associated protein
MQMQLGSNAQIPDGLLAANALLSEKPRQGFRSDDSTLRWASSVLISSTAIGMSGTLYDSRIRSHYTGKERDAESGNDYFGARYYASSMGRWMSPDPSMESEILEVPQTWNRYSYVYNRPLYGTDPDGRCPPCVGALIGGVVGGISEGGFSAVSQYLQKGSVDWGEVGANAAGGAVSGAITGGIAGATGGLSLLGDAALGAGANAVGGEVTRLIEGKDTSASDVVEDAVAGYAGGVGGHIAADLVHIPSEPKAPNNLKSYLKMKKYNAKVFQRNVAKGIQTGVGTATGTPPAHSVSGVFWLFDLFGNVPPPPPPPPAPCATTSATDSQGNSTGTSGCQ